MVLAEEEVRERPHPRRQAGTESREFVALMATCMGMAALSIDLMLPAFADMREDVGLAPSSNAVSWVLTDACVAPRPSPVGCPRRHHARPGPRRGGAAPPVTA